MQHTLAKQLEAGPTIALSFDQFQLGHMAFYHAVIDRSGETGSHGVFVLLDPGSKGLKFCNSALRHLSQPGI